MSIPYVVDGETELSSELFNPWVDHMNGLQTGALPIPLAGIEGALEEYGPLSHVREGLANVRDFGAVGDGVHDDTPNIQAAINSGAAVVEYPHPDDFYKTTEPLYPIANQLHRGRGGYQDQHVSTSRLVRIYKTVAEGPVFYLEGADCVGFRDLAIRGTASTSDTTEMGIYGHSSRKASISQCHLFGFGGSGIRCDREIGVPAGSWWVDKNLTTGCVYADGDLADYVGAIHLNAHDHWVTNNEFNTSIDAWDSGYRAAMVLNGSTSFITSNMFEHSEAGLVLLGEFFAGNQVIGNRADHCYGHGFVIESESNRFIGNLSYKNSQAANDTYDGFVNSGVRNQFLGNMALGEFDDPNQMRYGFVDMSTPATAAVANEYIGNTTYRMATGSYLLSDNKNAWVDFLERATYAASNVSTDRSFNADATTTEELADVLGTLIADLRAKGIVL